MNCPICFTALTDKNRSLTHIIPQSIGGNIKSRNLLCRDCNKWADEKFDNKVYQNFSFFAIVLNTYRDRKDHRKIKLETKGGDFVLLCPGGKITKLSPIERFGDKLFRIYYNTAKEFESLKKKYLSRVEITLENPVELDKSIILYEDYKTFKIGFLTGDLNILNGILLMAYLYYLENDGLINFVDKIPEYLQGRYAGIQVYPYAYPLIAPKDCTNENIYHSILVIGDNAEKKLTAIVELFSAFRYKVILSKNYIGPNIYKITSMNIFTGRHEENKKLFSLKDFRIPRIESLQQLSESMISSFVPLRKVINAFFMQKLIGKKLDFQLGSYSPGTMVTQAIVDEMGENAIFGESHFEILS